MIFCFSLAVIIRLVQWVGVVQWTQQYTEGVGGDTVEEDVCGKT